MRRWPLAARVLGAVIAALGAYATWATLQPNLAVEVEQPVNQEGQFSPFFLVRNSGFATAKDVKFSCAHVGWHHRDPGAVWSKEWQDARPRPKGPEYDDIGDLEPGAQMIRKCVVLDPPEGFTPAEGTMLIPMLSYRSWLAPWRTNQSFLFESVNGSEGLWAWRSRGNGLSQRQVKWLHERGHETVELNGITQKLEVKGRGSD